MTDKQSVIEKMAWAIGMQATEGVRVGSWGYESVNKKMAAKVAARILIEDMKDTIALDKHAAQIVYRFIDAYAKENGVD